MGFVIGIGSMADIIIRSGRAANWWDPNNAGLSIAGAYRAINSVGTPWPGGPTLYAQSLVNQANPGVNDLVEGPVPGVPVPWGALTGWALVEAQARYLDTGLVPAADQSWSVIAQYANRGGGINIQYVVGVFNGVSGFFGLAIEGAGGGNRAYYLNGSLVGVMPTLVTGNLCTAGAQGYRDGAAEGGAIGVWTVPSALSLYIGARHDAGGPLLHVEADVESIAIYNGGAAAVQAGVAAIAAAMLTL